MRKARVYDAAGLPEGPRFAADHPRIDDMAERERIASFLAGGAWVLRTTGHDIDRIDPNRGEVVPLTMHTDGVWLWSTALGYYVATHGIAPEPDFLDHIRSCGYRAAMPDEHGKREARAMLNINRQRQTDDPS